MYIPATAENLFCNIPSRVPETVSGEPQTPPPGLLIPVRRKEINEDRTQEYHVQNRNQGIPFVKNS